MTTVSTLNRLSPSMALSTNPQLQTPSFYLKPPSLTHLRFSEFLAFPLIQKSAINNPLLHCRCGTLTVDGDHPTSVLPQSGSMLFSLFQGMGFSEKETEAILETNAALNFVSFETIRTRIQYLQSAGVTGLALSRLIVKRPEVLTAQETGAMLSFIVNNDESLDLKGKIEPAQVERLLNVREPGFLLGFERKVRLLLEFGIPKENIVHVLNTVNLTKALCLRSLDELDRMLLFLGRFGGADLILGRPAILNYDLDTQLVPRIGFLLKLSGGNEAATATVLRKLPFVLAYTVDHVKDHVEFLNSYAGMSYEEIFKIILVYPSLFSASRKRKLHPRIDFLKQCGLSSNDIF